MAIMDASLTPTRRLPMTLPFPPFPLIGLPLQVAAFNMFVALACGALIGSERQVRQRMAGLRTNALVALGAAAFVTFSTLFPDEVSPTRVAAQVVSGIGFLGAGIIFRDGFTIHGINTAATLWCSAGVGMMAGAGAWPHALVLTALVVLVNLGLRPLVRWLKRRTPAGRRVLQHHRLDLTCAAPREGEVRAFLLRTLALGGLQVSEIEVRPGTMPATLDIAVILSGDGAAWAAIEQAMARVAAEPGLARVKWQAIDDA